MRKIYIFILCFFLFTSNVWAMKTGLFVTSLIGLISGCYMTSYGFSMKEVLTGSEKVLKREAKDSVTKVEILYYNLLGALQFETQYFSDPETSPVAYTWETAILDFTADGPPASVVYAMYFNHHNAIYEDRSIYENKMNNPTIGWIGVSTIALSSGLLIYSLLADDIPKKETTWNFNLNTSIAHSTFSAQRYF